MRFSFHPIFFSAFLFVISVSQARAEIIEYEFDVDFLTVNYTGEPVQAMSVGGSIPAPTIEATVGDTLRVTFHNKMGVETSVHWHGILLPNDQDGVPYLTTPPIKSGTSFTYEFPVIHHGTYWYHSHTGLQEQRGVYGSILFHPKDGEIHKTDHDAVLVLSDWTNENPNDVMRNLKRSDDYYALKKDSVQSWLKVIQHGKEAISNRVNGAWMRMGPMDISDVGYDAFLSNGQKQFHMNNVQPGETVRLRVINAAASSYFYIQYAGGPMRIVAVDGVDIEPIRVDRQRLAIAETYDVVVTVPDHKSYEFRATSEDGTGYSSTLLGHGELVSAPNLPRPNPFLMDHSEHGEMSHTGDHEPAMQMETMPVNHVQMDHGAMNHGTMNHSDMGHNGMDQKAMDHQSMSHEMQGMAMAEEVSDMVEYELLRAIEPTHYDSDNPKRVVELNLTGDMERYAWSFNNKVLSEESKILIKRGETVQFVLKNDTMMHHPLHLHGHFFRVLNGQGDYAPLKHTVNVPPMETVTIEFLANEQKDWFFHCHNLYHMKSGMARVVSYEETTQATPESLKPLFADRHWYQFADIGFQSNVAEGEIWTENTRNTFSLDYAWDYDDEYEVEATYERYLSRFLQLHLGAETEQEDDERETLGFIGGHYLLPLLVEAEFRVDTDGHSRLGLSSELQLTDRTSFEWEVNTDDEYRLQLDYEINKNFSITANKDDQYDWGIGILGKF